MYKLYRDVAQYVHPNRPVLSNTLVTIPLADKKICKESFLFFSSTLPCNMHTCIHKLETLNYFFFQIDGSQELQPLSQALPIDASDTDESQIMAARQRAVREQDVNPEHPNNHRSTPEPENDDPGPSRASLPISSNAHMFLFQQESQEELSQPSEEDQPSPSLLETKQHVVKLMQESKKDLVEVMKALLKASGDVTLALSYLLDEYDPEVHGPIWTRHDDEILLSDDSFDCERLHEKYGAESVAKRAAFLKGDF